MADPDNAQGGEDEQRVRGELLDGFGAAQDVIDGVGQRPGDQGDRAADGIGIERVGDGKGVVGQLGIGLGKIFKLFSSNQYRNPAPETLAGKLRHSVHFLSLLFTTGRESTAGRKNA